MNSVDTLSLQVCTPAGVAFDRKIVSVSARSIVGDMCILRGHANYMTRVENGKVLIKTEDEEINARCSGGFISVIDNEVRIFVNFFEA